MPYFLEATIYHVKRKAAKQQIVPLLELISVGVIAYLIFSLFIDKNLL